MAGIIKAGRDAAHARTLGNATFNFDDVTEKAQRYLAGVQQQAARLLKDARQQADQIRQQAQQEGAQQAQTHAEQAAREQAKQQWQTVEPAVRQAIAELENARQHWVQHWEQNVVRLAVAIAERVVRREVEQKPEITLSLVREALELAAGGTRLKLHLHPEDYETLGDQVRKLAAQLSNVTPSDIVPDPEIGRGGCRLTTEYGSVDQQLETQLARIEQELL